MPKATHAAKDPIDFRSSSPLGRLGTTNGEVEKMAGFAPAGPDALLRSLGGEEGGDSAATLMLRVAVPGLSWRASPKSDSRAPP